MTFLDEFLRVPTPLFTPPSPPSPLVYWLHHLISCFRYGRNKNKFLTCLPCIIGCRCIVSLFCRLVGFPYSFNLSHRIRRSSFVVFGKELTRGSSARPKELWQTQYQYPLLLLEIIQYKYIYTQEFFWRSCLFSKPFLLPFLSADLAGSLFFSSSFFSLQTYWVQNFPMFKNSIPFLLFFYIS